MYPFYFGKSDSPLYGVYHPPHSRAESSTKGVLLCQPMAHEYMRSHLAMRQLANRLSAKGVPCLRFDYFGTGDSSGERYETKLERWLEDIHMAKEELVSLSGVKDINAVGLRLGASLLMKAVENGLSVKNLVLWDPIVSGADYLHTLQRLHRLKMKKILNGHMRIQKDQHNYSEELLGYPYPLDFQKEIQHINLLKTVKIELKKLQIVITEPGNEHQLLKMHLNSLCSNVKVGIANGTPGYWDIPDELGNALISNEAIKKIVDEIA